MRVFSCEKSLAERGCWLYIKPERIVAKTKADVLQKALVLLQVSYAATSCVARRVCSLPLTLLEVHTMVHVICAVAMYALWFKVSPEYSVLSVLALSLLTIANI